LSPFNLWWKNTVNAAGTDGNNISVKHHKGLAPIAFQEVLQMKITNGLLLPVFKPEVAWNLAVMLIGFAVAALPVVILTGSNPEPGNKVRHSDTGLLGPVFDKVDHAIPEVVGNPGRF